MTENSAGEWHFDLSAVQIGSRLPVPVQHYLTYGHREFFYHVGNPNSPSKALRPLLAE